VRKEILNGAPIPYDAPIEKLKKLLSSPSMKDFSLSCEALSYSNNPEAYDIMLSHIDDKDKYRRLYILKTIFRHPHAVELIDRIEAALTSDDPLFVRTALIVIATHNIKVSDALLLSTVAHNLPELCTELQALHALAPSEENYLRLTGLFNKAITCSQKEYIGEVLSSQYLPAKASDLFELFRQNPFAKIRILSLNLGKRYGFDISDFLHDSDGHVRKMAE
jgi:hypothetical protein